MDIKRYYTFEDMIDNPDNRIGDRLIPLHRFLKSLNVDLYMNMDCFREELAKVGVILLNKEYAVQTFVFHCESQTKADVIEAEIKKYCRGINILVNEVVAKLDYEIVCEKATEGLLYLTEEIVMPNDITDMEALLYPYIDALHADDKTLIVTDPYLYAKDDSDYIRLVEKLFVRARAAVIKSYMPAKRLNSTAYQTITNLTVNISYSFIPYPDCHDRFWLCPDTKKGFCMGTSLNGLGSKIARVDLLREDEVQALLDELGSLNNATDAI